MKTFRQLRSNLNEDKRLRDESIPAPMLVLRRKGIRIFPDGKHVALYTNDKYNLIFTIPYGGSASNTDELEASPLMGTPNNG